MTVREAFKAFADKAEKLLTLIVHVIMSVVFVAVFLFVVSLTSYMMTVVYLWNRFGEKMSSSMISMCLPDAFLISLAFWLFALVLYKRYME